MRVKCSSAKVYRVQSESGWMPLNTGLVFGSCPHWNVILYFDRDVPYYYVASWQVIHMVLPM